METFNIEAGKTCKIDAGDTGVTLNGPAIVICIEFEGKDLEEINLPIQITNQEKLNLVIGKLLDQFNESLDKKEAINTDTLIALQGLIPLTGY